MIKTASDFEAALKELTVVRDSLTQTYDSDMSSKTHNQIFRNIEKELNALYEQLRILEDIKDYCRSSVMQAIAEEKTKLMDKLRIIEHASDSFSDASCMAYEVGLAPAAGIKVRDRNGDALPSMRNVNGKLEVDGLDGQRGTVSTVKCTTAGQCYSNTARNLISGKASRSLYLLGEPEHDGIVESYEVMFKEPVRCNYININTVNCNAEDVKAILNSKGATAPISSAEGYIDEKNICGLKFSVRATNYEYRDVVIDRQKGNNSFALLNDDYYKRRNSAKTIETFVAETEKKNAQRYINEFMADAVKAGK